MFYTASARRTTASISWVFTSIVLLTSSSAQVSTEDTERPNLLIIMTDQQSLWTLSAYGGTIVSTPNIDSIAKEGALFTNFFTNNALCTPSRASFLTGRYPHAHGAWKNDIALKPNEVTLAHVLRREGYATGYAGKWHLAGDPKPGWMDGLDCNGFDDCRFMYNRGHWGEIVVGSDGKPQFTEEIGDESTYTTDWFFNKGIDFIREKRATPFFYMISIPDPHGPVGVRSPYNTMFKREEMPIPDSFSHAEAEKPDWARKENAFNTIPQSSETKIMLRNMKRRYAGKVKCIDDNVGRVLDALRNTGQLDNTIVVYSSDHGAFIGEHGLLGKLLPYDEAFHIPLIVRWPRMVPADIRIDNVLSTVDFMPTILGLMQIEGSRREQGRSAAPILRGEASDWKDEAFMHSSHLGLLGVWTPEYELAYMKGSTPVLFDRKKDPAQITNLFDDPEHNDIVRNLTDRLIEHTNEIDDPAVEWLKTTAAPPEE